MSRWHHRAILTLGLQPLAYRLAEAYHQLSLRFPVGKAGRPVLVYQMGKVGSSSLARTLEYLAPESTVYHVHSLTDGGMQDILARSTAVGRAYPGPDYWQAKHIRVQLAGSFSERVRVISLTRDPVARNVSGFFQSLSLWSDGAVKRFGAGERRSLFEELLRVFLRDYPHHKPHTWFETELRPVFGVDVYEREFDKSSGYSTYDGTSAKVLVIRLENLSGCYRQALQQFLDQDTSNVNLARVNEAGQKDYDVLYREFLHWLALPEDYLQSQYGTRYARHFYSAAERTSFGEKWRERSS